MNKADVSKIINNSKIAITKRSPEILMCIGITGMFGMTGLAIRATPKAITLIEEAKKEQKVDKLAPIETVKVAWKPYIPAAITGVFSVACLIGSSSVNAKRNVALATAYKLSETAFSEYKEKVVETIGEKKEKAVRDKVNKSRVEKNPPKQNHIIVTGRGETLCLDTISGRYFYSDIEKLRKAENIINKRLLDEMYISLSEFYDEIGLEPTSMSDYIGWDIQKGYVELYLSAQMTEEEKPCIAIEFSIPPTYNFSEFS